MIELSAQQTLAIDAVRAFLESDRQYFLLAGYAGTGKTTLAPEIAELVGWDVLFGSYTGKAALRLREKGCPTAETIHRLIYLPRIKCQEKLKQLKAQLAAEADEDRKQDLERQVERERKNLSRPEFTLNVDSEVRGARLVIVDEASMIGRRMGNDILSFGTKVLALGDPAQLPPVGEACFFKGMEPDFLLDEVHRQAKDSGVLRLATHIRENYTLPEGAWDLDDVRIIPRGVLKVEQLLDFDQVICGYNKTRKALNDLMRAEAGFKTGLPEAGDKLICLKNDHDRGLLNGSQWHVRAADVVDDDIIMLSLVTDYQRDEPVDLLAHRHYFEGREKEIAPWDIPTAGCFDFGYAITCHKAQGSEWDDVLVIDEPVPRDQSARWRYTAVTRASQSITVVR